ncbi:MAG: right-handed parallel beta-helix repeat-containing protein, partial [Lentisphaeraceae bacterium]|nr:right-handed parallel beta-helix repeat-containing protein [Lentisphaeraceae bacterium]
MSFTSKLKLSLITLLSGFISSVGAKDFYISPTGNDQNPGTVQQPFATLVKARNTIRQLGFDRRQEDMHIYLRGGTYKLSKTFKLELIDSAPEGFKVYYQAYNNETPILSSGVSINNWKLSTHPDIPAAAKGKVWEAVIPAGISKPRMLFDGDKWQPRASSEAFVGTQVKHEKADSMGPLHQKDLRLCKHVPYDKKFDKIFRNWKNIGDIECAMVPVPWTMSLIQLKDINLEKRFFTLAYHANSPAYGKNHFCTNWLENSIDFISEAGNWASNTQEGKVYYWPQADKPGNMLFPALDVLVKLEGKIDYDGPVDTPVRNIVLKGITFKHAKRTDWYKNRKGWGIQHDWDTFDFDNALLRLRGTENCEITQCHFTSSGASAIRLDLHAQNINVNNNLISYVGHMGILLCGYGPGSKDVNRNNIIDNNIIHHCGE